MLSTLVHHGFVSNENADFKILPLLLTTTIFTAVLCRAGGGCPGDVLQPLGFNPNSGLKRSQVIYGVVWGLLGKAPEADIRNGTPTSTVDPLGFASASVSASKLQLIKPTAQIRQQLRGPKINGVCGQMEQDTPAEPQIKDTKSAKSMTRRSLLS